MDATGSLDPKHAIPNMERRIWMLCYSCLDSSGLPGAHGTLWGQEGLAAWSDARVRDPTAKQTFKRYASIHDLPTFSELPKLFAIYSP